MNRAEQIIENFEQLLFELEQDKVENSDRPDVLKYVDYRAQVARERLSSILTLDLALTLRREKLERGAN